MCANQNILNLIKEVRLKTGLSVVKCKEALFLCNFDVSCAVEYLIKNCAQNVKKNCATSSSHGNIAVSLSDDSCAVAVVVVSCKTDFVAGTDIFKSYIKKLVDCVLKFKLFNKIIFDESCEVEIQALIYKDREVLENQVGEFINICRVFYLGISGGVFGCYSHCINKIVKVVSIVYINVHKIDVANNLAIHLAAVVLSNELLCEVIDTDEENRKKFLLKKMNIILNQPYSLDRSILVKEYLQQQHVEIVDFFLFKL